jgi:hypothetical protein
VVEDLAGAAAVEQADLRLGHGSEAASRQARLGRGGEVVRREAEGGLPGPSEVAADAGKQRQIRAGSSPASLEAQDDEAVAEKIVAGVGGGGGAPRVRLGYCSCVDSSLNPRTTIIAAVAAVADL